MKSTVYKELRSLLDTIPNGFPSTEDGLELKILQKIFTEEEAALALQLSLEWETPDAVAARTGLDAAFLKEKLAAMQARGLIFGATIGPVSLYKLFPFVFGIYEMQLYRLDSELVEMCERYMNTAFGKEFYRHTPSLLKVLPIEEEIPPGSAIEPYESISTIISSAKSWGVGDCICKTEKGILGEPCTKPTEVCMGIAPVENFFDDHFWGRPITKEEALAILKKSEEAGLVHMTNNFKKGHYAICNCCSCCCGILRGMNELGQPNATAASNYRAVVDESLCTACGICLDRCQVHALDIEETAIINKKCIGCGLCATTCPTGAIRMEKRHPEEMLPLPENEKEWMAQREEARGGSFRYRELFLRKKQ